MSVDATKLVIPGHGTVFHAPKNFPAPANPLETFSLTGATPTGWTNLGHTSKANTIALTKDGGEKESLDTYLQDAVRTVYSAQSWGVTIPALQFDGDVLDLAFNGDINPATGGYIVPGSVDPVEAALFLYFQDNSGALGFWIPNTVVTLGEPPSVDPAAFMELPLAATVQGADGATIPAVGGKAGIMEIYKTGLTAIGAPSITSAVPGSAEAGAVVTITGTNLGAASSVKFGTVEAAMFQVISGTQIKAVVPVGATGAANITVTTPKGVTAPFTYTRG